MLQAGALGRLPAEALGCLPAGLTSTQVILDGRMQTFILTVDLCFFIWHMVTMIMTSSMVAMTTVTNTARTIIRVVSSSLLPVDVESLAETGPVGS